MILVSRSLRTSIHSITDYEIIRIVQKLFPKTVSSLSTNNMCEHKGNYQVNFDNT